jgi:hypothetical protein
LRPAAVEIKAAVEVKVEVSVLEAAFCRSRRLSRLCASVYNAAASEKEDVNVVEEMSLRRES